MNEDLIENTHNDSEFLSTQTLSHDSFESSFQQDTEDEQALEKHPIITANQQEELDKPSGDPLSVANFLKQLSTLTSAEEKIQACIAYMKKTLAQEGAPYFKGFWEARSQCTALFKEGLNPQLRSELWKEYRELCQEFQKLKEVLDEQALFAAEQIEIAIQAMENDLDHFSELLAKLAEPTFSFKPKSLHRNFKLYVDLQKELNFLNTYASKINSLRKELIKTEMRIRQKNKFFQALSSLGDKIFPKRKDLIKKLSDLFLHDTHAFVANYFGEDSIQGPLFFIRDEIKALQAIAKILTLNTYSFTTTRNELSKCWDSIKLLEKEKKKEQVEKRAIFQSNKELVLAQIQLFQEKIQNGEITASDLHAKSDEIYEFMHTLELGREEKQALHEAINLASKPILDELKQQEQERINKERALIEEKAQKVISLKSRVQELIDSAAHHDAAFLTSSRDALLEEIHVLSCLKSEKQLLEKALKHLKDIIHDKMEKALLALSSDDLHALDQLKSALNERKEQRKELKSQLEANRKASGSSSLSFEKALLFHEAIQEERVQLEKIDAIIKEIELKIKAFSQKAKS
ncbi:MAG: hypothetical protein P4L16_06115 [Chlamydiales bacterium]|nr:hypothetical protein [Chlamydiales bacterium]